MVTVPTMGAPPAAVPAMTVDVVAVVVDESPPQPATASEVSKGRSLKPSLLFCMFPPYLRV